MGCLSHTAPSRARVQRDRLDLAVLVLAPSYLRVGDPPPILDPLAAVPTSRYHCLNERIAATCFLTAALRLRGSVQVLGYGAAGRRPPLAAFLYFASPRQ